MSRAIFDIQIEGLDQAIKELNKLKRGVGRRIMRKAVSAALRPMRDSLRRMVPVDTRTLKRALGTKIKTYRATGYTVGYAGPRGGMARVATSKRWGHTHKHDPMLYAHFIEKRTGIWSSVYNSQARSSMAIMSSVIWTEIQRL